MNNTLYHVFYESWNCQGIYNHGIGLLLEHFTIEIKSVKSNERGIFMVHNFQFFIWNYFDHNIWGSFGIMNILEWRFKLSLTYPNFVYQNGSLI